jgi:hypothetical protein
VGFDRLLVATGVRAPRPWPNAAEAALDGLFALRNPDDAEARMTAETAGITLYQCGIRRAAEVTLPSTGA